MRPAPLRAGDRVAIVRPTVVLRVGYARVPADFAAAVEEPEVQGHLRAALDALGRAIGREIRLAYDDAVMGRVKRDLAFVCARTVGFGGGMRSLHTEERPYLAHRVAVVERVRSAWTGRYFPGSEGSSPRLDDDWGDPPELVDRVHHRIATLRVLGSPELVDVEVANLERVT